MFRKSSVQLGSQSEVSKVSSIMLPDMVESIKSVELKDYL